LFQLSFPLNNKTQSGGVNSLTKKLATALQLYVYEERKSEREREKLRGLNRSESAERVEGDGWCGYGGVDRKLIPFGYASGDGESRRRSRGA